MVLPFPGVIMLAFLNQFSRKKYKSLNLFILFHYNDVFRVLLL